MILASVDRQTVTELLEAVARATEEKLAMLACSAKNIGLADPGMHVAQEMVQVLSSNTGSESQ